ncbi:MAG: hypothetical protein HUK06_08545 [Bacteroidaceae bacterium]|nr:hypothetical protein [Bacteroidaceae bacterium]
MQVELSNFLTLLSTGAFDTAPDVQPMSRFKWQRLMQYAKKEGVGEFLVYGIQRSIYGQDVLQKEQMKSLEEMYEYKRGIYSGFRNNPKPVTRFSNQRLRRRMRKVFTDEVHKYDAQMPKLALIDLMGHFLKEAFYGRFSFLDVIRMGLYLRQEGDRVDFNGVDDDISALGLTKTANLVGTILVNMFGFSQDEIQFLKSIDSDYIDVVKHYFDISLSEMSAVRHRERTGSLRVMGAHDHSRISARRGLYYFRYHRCEAISSYFANIGRSITMIEE